LQYI
jgi:hypothetical protein